MAKKEQRQKNNRKSKNISFAIAAWLVLALVILIFFMIERKTIVGNLQDFFAKVFVSKTQEQPPTEKTDLEVPSQIEITTPENISAPITILQTENSAAGGASVPILEQTQNSSAGTGAQQSAPQTKIENPATSQKEAAAENSQAVQQTIRTELCFVVIDSGDGSVRRKIVTRDLPRSSAPLTAALNALLAGPTPAEQNANSTTLIPSGTKLLGASVRDGIAYLNFSEEFEINNVGVEGYTAQMMQIVYTATNFSTVDQVQFLINGERKEYLGSEGLWIGSALSRNSFR